MNLRYHQYLQKWFERWDRGVKITVGIFAVIGLLTAFPSVSNSAVGIAFATISLILAGILNAVPVGEWARTHAELFRLWSDLRTDAVLEEYKLCEAGEIETVPPVLSVRLSELVAKSESLHADEPAPDQKLLLRCIGDEIESRWGSGIRTAEQAEGERLRRNQVTSSAVESPVLEATGAMV